MFFPAAALYAALAVPLAVHAMTSPATWTPGLVGPGHAHEMLFGFALALIAGYLLGPVSVRLVAFLFLLWLAARVSYAFAPGSPAAAVSSPLFAVVLAACVVPKFRSAKKWRNRAIIPLLVALCALPAVYAAAMQVSRFGTAYQLLPAGIVLLALLMAFMGGRVIAPAAAGAFYRRGLNLEERVQPPLEAAVILLLAVAAVGLLNPHLRSAAALAIFSAGICVLFRLFRWQLWVVRDQPDLMCLAAGYGWLGLGLLLLGGMMGTGSHPIPALHVISVGALGTLSICVMTRVHLQHGGGNPADAPLVTRAVVLIAVATVLRFAASLNFEFRVPLLWLAAAGWSAAYLLAVAVFLTPVRRRMEPVTPHTPGGR